MVKLLQENLNQDEIESYNRPVKAYVMFKSQMQKEKVFEKFETTYNLLGLPKFEANNF